MLDNPHRYPFKAGDLLLCSSSILTRFFAHSVWGHVGIVYRDPQTSLLYVWETQIPVQGTWWTFTNSLKSKATRLTPLYRYLKRCPKPLCVRPINQEVDVDRFCEFVKKKWDQPFAFDFLVNGANRVFMDVVNVPVLTRTKRSARYCAELVAETFAYLGVFDFKSSVDEGVRPNTIIPRDFGQEHQRLPLVNGWSFGDEVLLAT